jgi:hypothetical protein
VEPAGILWDDGSAGPLLLPSIDVSAGRDAGAGNDALTDGRTTDALPESSQADLSAPCAFLETARLARVIATRRGGTCCIAPSGV